MNGCSGGRAARNSFSSAADSPRAESIRLADTAASTVFLLTAQFKEL